MGHFLVQRERFGVVHLMAPNLSLLIWSSCVMERMTVAMVLMRRPHFVKVRLTF